MENSAKANIKNELDLIQWVQIRSPALFYSVPYAELKGSFYWSVRVVQVYQILYIKLIYTLPATRNAR